MNVFVSFIFSIALFVIFVLAFTGYKVFIGYLKFCLKNPTKSISDWLRDLADKVEH